MFLTYSDTNVYQINSEITRKGPLLTQWRVGQFLRSVLKSSTLSEQQTIDLRTSVYICRVISCDSSTWAGSGSTSTPLD